MNHSGQRGYSPSSFYNNRLMLEDFSPLPVVGNAPASALRQGNPTIDSVEVLLKKYECHCCYLNISERFIVKCLNPACQLYFCRPCLIRFYKYSRKIAKCLPSPTWKCPCCSNKCQCSR